MASSAPSPSPPSRPAPPPQPTLGAGPLLPLAANEERLRHIVEATPGLTWTTDPEGRVTYANQRLFDYTGLEPGRQTRDWVRRVVHPEDYPRADAAWRNARRDGGAYEIELRMRRADGVYRWFLVRATPTRDGSTPIAEWIAHAADIDTRRRSEENLRFLAAASAALGEVGDRESTLARIARLAVPHFADWSEVTVRDPGGGVRRLAVNHRDPDQTRHVLALRERFPPEETEAALTVIRTGEPVFVPELNEEMLRAAARGPEHLEMLGALGLRSYLCVPMRSKSRVLGAIAFASAESARLFDEFDLRTAEELARRAAIAIENAELVQALREADRRKDEFLAILAHELRNPLAPVRNAIEILRAAPPPAPHLQWTHDVIDRQVRQMSRLVDDLLDLSRITSGKLELRRERVELGAAVQTALEACRPLVDRGGHEVSLHLPPEPVWLDADQARLSQVLCNLINNAAKYTRPGGHIWLTAYRRGSEAVVRVRDNGIGIAPDMLHRIFDMFTQAAGGADHSQGGLGIGLTLVRRLAELHGGRVDVRSEGRGKGSEFAVRLPVSARDAAAGEANAEAAAAAAPGKRRILVVDDNRDAADSLSMLLQSTGHETRVAYDGLEAVGAAIAFRPDAVLLDIGLPKLSGYDAAGRIREARGADVLLVAVTGWGQEEDRRRAKEAGFDHHLTKPVDPKALARILAADAPAGG